LQIQILFPLKKNCHAASQNFTEAKLGQLASETNPGQVVQNSGQVAQMETAKRFAD